jgi:hypothetical protein
VNVPTRRELAGVEIRVRVEPQHAKLLPLLAAATRDGADRPDAQRVVTTEQNRQPAETQFGKHGIVNSPIPVHHFR